MQSSVPKTCLRMAEIGDKVKVVGDSMNRTFTVEIVREDGYIELYCNGRPNMTASQSTEIRFVKP